MYNLYDYAFYKNILINGLGNKTEFKYFIQYNKKAAATSYKTIGQSFKITQLPLMCELFNEEGFVNFSNTTATQLKTTYYNFVTSVMDESHFFFKTLQRTNLLLHNLYVTSLVQNAFNLKVFSEVYTAFQDNYQEFFLTTQAQNSQYSLTLNQLVALRKSAKSLIVTFNAIQKVFRTRFDESRSHTSIRDFSTYKVAQPFISDTRPGYEALITKNNTGYFTANWYVSVLNKLHNNYCNFTAATNYYAYDLSLIHI